MVELKLPKSMRGQSRSHAHAPRQEAKAAKLVGGKTTPGSGAGYQGADVRRRKLVRIECKSTVHARLGVTREMIDKLDAASFGTDEVPVIQVDLLGDPARNTRDVRAYVVRADAMEDLLERLTRDPAG